MRLSILILALLKIVLVWHGQALDLNRASAPLQTLTPAKRAYNGPLFYYWHCLELEHLGDLDKDFTNMSAYSAQEISTWVQAIEQLDVDANLLPFLLSYYFATPHNSALTLACVSALEDHCFKAIKQKWRFVVQATLIAKHYLQDQTLALHLANRLLQELEPKLQPLFIQALPATLLTQQSPEAAVKIYQDILANNSTLSLQELSFIKNRIKILKELLST
jgi:uncharacterized membrane protein